MNDKICDEIEQSCNDCGLKTIFGIPLESADPRLLDVREAGLDEHVALQPAAIAYFGSLKKEAVRQLDALKRAYDRDTKRWYALAKSKAKANDSKATVADIEAQLIIDNDKAIEQWEDRLRAAQQQLDLIDVWYEAWKQKSFSIKEYANLVAEELYQNPHLVLSQKAGRGEEKELKSIGHSGNLDKIRSIIRQNQEKE